MKRFVSILLVAVLLLCCVSAAFAEGGKRTIHFWHCFGGTIGQAVQANVDAFNASQNEIYVEAEYVGSYDETFTKIKQSPVDAMPDVFQMFEMATAYLKDQDYEFKTL